MADVVLVHSTGQGAAGWNRLIAALAVRRIAAHAVELPDDPSLRAAEFARLTREQVGAVTTPVVLAHSGSGPLLPSIARQLGAAHQIWLAAWAPAADTSFNDDVRANLSEAFDPEWVGKDPVTDDDAAREFLYHDCDEPTLRWALGTRRGFYPAAAYQQLLPTALDIPSTYIVATQDRTIRPSWQRRMAIERLGVQPFDVDAGHCPNVSQPQRLADLIEPLCS